MDERGNEREADALRCAFCGKGQREVRQLVAGPSAYICDACITLCVDLLHEDGGAGLERSATWTLSDQARPQLQAFQRWFRSHGGHPWEHDIRVEIRTLESPAWEVQIDLSRTPLAGVASRLIAEAEDGREWFRCRVDDGVFNGVGGPTMLGQILHTFLEWQRDASPPGG